MDDKREVNLGIDSNRPDRVSLSRDWPCDLSCDYQIHDITGVDFFLFLQDNQL